MPLREPRGGYHPRGGLTSPPRAGQGHHQPKGRQGQGQGLNRQHSQASQPKTNLRRDLEQYFAKNNLGDVPFKIATLGAKGKEKYMATVTVEGQQFKTYPTTYNSQVEAEEALASIIVTKL